MKQANKLTWVLVAIVSIAATVALASWIGRPVPLVIEIPPIGAEIKDLDLARIRSAVEQFSSTASRVTGYPGAEQTATQIVAELRAMGVTEIEEQPFEVAAPIVSSATLRANGPAGPTELAIHPLWPNLARTGQTPPEGLSGPLVYVGKGTEGELAGKQLRGAIVVMDFDSNVEWLSVPEFGGKAILFRHSSQATGNTARNKLLSVPANIPRYYVAEAQTSTLDALIAMGGEVRIDCLMDWERAKARNILARVTGGDNITAGSPPPGLDHRPIVIQAYYDSISVVPTQAPGAEQAISPATLLELARFFRSLPAAPRRPVYVLFTAGHGQALQGMIHWTRMLKDGLQLGWPAGRETSLMARMGEPGLVVGLDLSSRSTRLGLFAMGGFRGQNEGILRPKFSKLGLTLEQFSKNQSKERAPLGLPQQFTDCINMTIGRSWWTYFPYRAAFSSEIATSAGFPGVTLSTINDDRRAIDTPLDTADRLQWEQLGYQLGHQEGVRPGLSRLGVALAYWRGPFTSSPLEDVWSRIEGRVVWLDQERDYTPNRPLSGAMVFLKTLRADKYLLGTRGIPALMADANGAFTFDGLIDTTANWAFSNCTLEAYATSTARFERENPGALRELVKVRAGRGSRDTAAEGRITYDGSIVYALDMARAKDYPWTVSLVKTLHNLNLVAFPCKSFTLFGLTEPRGYSGLKDLTILDAATQSPPFQFGRSSTDLTAGMAEENCITLWADPTLRMRLTLGFGFQEKRLVLVNNTAEDPVGAGFVLDQLDSIPSMVLQGARDMNHLNAWRIEKFNTHGVKNPRVQKQHAEAGVHLAAAEKALAALDYQAYRSEADKGWALESKAYSELLSMTNDMIRGVLFYLALLIPFAYCIERLVFASGTVKARIILMVTIFLAGFMILALIHPAFRFTMTPFIVLLAFIILMLAATVSLLIVGKFDGMMQERKTELVGQHEDTVSMGGIAVRAFDLGIANIRRRPQRGILTGATIVLVTFTLLSFTSLVPETSVSKLRHPDGNPVYKGLLARDRAWNGLPTPLFDSLKRTFEEQDIALGNDSLTGTVVAPRAWFFSDQVGGLSQIDLVPRPLTTQEVATRGEDTLTTAAANGFTAVALLALSPEEPRITQIDTTLKVGRWFQNADERTVIISDRAAEYLGLGAPDLGRLINIYGQDLELIGIFDSAKLNTIQDIDGEEITPVNFVMTQLTKAQSGDSEKADTLDDYQHYGSEQLALVPFMFGHRLGAPIRSVAIRTAQNIDPVAEAESFARRSNLTILASNLKQVMLLASLDTNRVSAAGQILIPVLLGFMMVLGTMLGSVYERRREIFVYNSVGLSPTHVAALFLAESSVYAIIGACMGYLLGQIISKVLLVTGMLGGIGLNYSAGTTVLVTLLTMFIVLASTIYPARQAFRAAIPESRSDEPEAEELEGSTDSINLYLPFVATPGSIFAMQAYMHEFLHGLEGVSVGRLAVETLRPALDEVHGHPSPALVFRAWLAPFDLGISHDARIRIVWRPERGIFQYQLSATRFSGDQQNWRRLTPWFIQALRKQLLMWRILSAAEHHKYEQLALALYGQSTYSGVAETLTMAEAAPAAVGGLETRPA